MAKIKDKDGTWHTLKSGDKIKDANGNWQTLKSGDKIKDANGFWQDLNIGSNVITLNLFPSNLMFQNIPAGDQIVTVTLLNSNQSWEIESKDSWITSTIKTAETELRIQPSVNMPGSPTRYGEITIHSIENNNVKKIITIYQDAGD